jgi:hypothetical protein
MRQRLHRRPPRNLIAPRTNFLHMVCDNPECAHTVSVALSETIEEAIARGRAMSAAMTGAPQITSTGAHKHDDASDEDAMVAALNAAACALGWRRVTLPDGTRQGFCASHVHGLVCYRCQHADCGCIGGPFFDAIRI